MNKRFLLQRCTSVQTLVDLRSAILPEGKPSQRRKSISTSQPYVPYLRKINAIRYGLFPVLIRLFSFKAVKALKMYYAARSGARIKTVEKLHDVMLNSLEQCYGCLKEVLRLFIEARDFVVASGIYQLLSEVALLDHDYPRAVKYFEQIVYP